MHDDVTALVDSKPGTAVIPFWEPIALNSASPGSSRDPPAAGAAAAPAGPVPSRRVLATSRDVADQLSEEGFQVCYRRIPLSRDRTPVAGDLQDLHAQLELRPALRPGAAAPSKVVHLVLSRTATGSSARFAAASLCTYLLAQGPEGKLPEPLSSAALSGPNGSSPARSASSPARGPSRGLSPAKPPAPGGGSPPHKRLKRSMSDLGEYRGIISVSRLLPKGTEVKGAVDEAIDRCSQIGNLREDIKACKHIAEAAPSFIDDPQTAAWAARQLGVHYLKRYFLLIAYRSFLDTAGAEPAGGAAEVAEGGEAAGGGRASFVKWMDERKELGHLLGHLSLET
jgi:hypothetical protein